MMILGGLILVGLIGNLGRGGSTASTTAQRSPSVATVVPSVRPSPTASAVPSKPDPIEGIGDGTWIVGVDIQPGTYRTSGATPGFFEYCSATTRAGASTNSAIIDWATANGNEPIVITIGPKVKAFQTTGCEPWKKVG